MRRRYITHPRFQMQFMFFSAAGMFVALSLLSFVGVLTLVLVADVPSLPADQKAFLLLKSKEFLWLVLGGTLALSCVFALVGFLFSYRLVGPLNRAEVWLERLLHGHNPPPLTIRPKDEMWGIVELMNRVREALEAKVEKQE